MEIHFFSKIVPLLVIMLFSLNIHAQGISDSMAIQSILQEEVVSWNKGDAKTYSQHFAKDGTFTNVLGLFFIGHAEFLSRHEQIFKGVFSGTTLKQELVSLKFADKDVAVVETLTWVTGFSKTSGPPKGTFTDESGRLRTRLLQVMKREGADWKIVTYHNIDLKPGVPAPEPR